MYFTNLFCLAIAFTCAIAASVQYDDLGKPVDKRINWQADKRILGGKNADEGMVIKNSKILGIKWTGRPIFIAYFTLVFV